jgi:hypothetical protein
VAHPSYAAADEYTKKGANEPYNTRKGANEVGALPSTVSTPNPCGSIRAPASMVPWPWSRCGKCFARGLVVKIIFKLGEWPHVAAGNKRTNYYRVFLYSSMCS